MAVSYRYFRWNGITPGTTPQVAEVQLLLSSVDQIPAMTAATTSGVTMSGDSTFAAGQEPWRAGDNSGATLFGSDAAGSGAFLKVDFGSATAIDSYSLRCPSGSTTFMWTAWTFAGSNDDSSYTTLDSQSGVTWSTSQVRTYVLPTKAMVWRRPMLRAFRKPF